MDYLVAGAVALVIDLAGLMVSPDNKAWGMSFFVDIAKACLFVLGSGLMFISARSAANYVHSRPADRSGCLLDAAIFLAGALCVYEVVADASFVISAAAIMIIGCLFERSWNSAQQETGS